MDTTGMWPWRVSMCEIWPVTTATSKGVYWVAVKTLSLRSPWMLPSRSAWDCGIGVMVALQLPYCPE